MRASGETDDQDEDAKAFEEKSDAALLVEIADKLDRLAPAVSGMDQYHSDRLRQIAENLRGNEENCTGCGRFMGHPASVFGGTGMAEQRHCGDCTDARLEKALSLTLPPTKAQIREEYVAKHKAYLSLVGALYPSVAYKELMQLREQYVAGTDSYWGDLPPIAPPRADGGAPHG